jgi:hypothetical protein
MMRESPSIPILDGCFGEPSGQLADDRFSQAADESSSTLFNDAVVSVRLGLALQAWLHV